MSIGPFIGIAIGTAKDITGVKTYRAQTGKSIKVYVKGKKLFAVDPACENYYVLLSRLEREGVVNLIGGSWL